MIVDLAPSGARSYRYPLAGVSGQTALIATGSGLLLPAAVLLGSRLIIGKSWGDAAKMALMTAGVLHLIGTIVTFGAVAGAVAAAQPATPLNGRPQAVAYQ